MIVEESGQVTGNLTGGCVEADITAHAERLFAESLSVESAPQHIVTTYGITDEWALGVGLLCGGAVEVLIELVQPAREWWIASLVDAIDAGRPVHLLSVVEDATVRHAVADREMHILAGDLAGMPMAVAQDIVSRELIGGVLLCSRHLPTRVHTCSESAGDQRVLVHCFGFERPQVVIAGANDYAAAVSSVAALLGYAPVICDPRPTFARAELFPDAEVRLTWPAEYLQSHARTDDIVIVLTHDAKIDVPALVAAVEVGAVYVGALGSRKTHEERCGRLARAGLTEAQIAGIRSPIGLDIGARTPEQSAVSIMAEVIAVHTGRSGWPLAQTRGPIRPVPAR